MQLEGDHMGTPGVKWSCKKETIVIALKASCGVISRASKALGVTHNTLLKRIREHEDLVQLLEELRNELEETMLDRAEEVLVFALKKMDGDLGNALKSCFYVLNNKGEKRGYSMKNNPNNSNAGMTLSDIKTIAQYVGSNKAHGKKVSRNRGAS